MDPIRVGIIGQGHLGKFLSDELAKLRDEFHVECIWNRSADEERGVLPLSALSSAHFSRVDLVVEVSHPSVIQQFGVLILQHSDLFIGSPTCLADSSLMSLLRDAAINNNRRVLVPAGAFWGGEDIQKMADFGSLKALTVTMTKHPNSFKLESPLKEKNEQAKAYEEPTLLYSGSVRALCPLAPNNVNTMAGAAVAAHNLGFDLVQANLIADPSMHDWHMVRVVAIGPDGFEVETIRRNPAKPGAVTGQQTFFSFLASIRQGQFKPKGGIRIC